MSFVSHKSLVMVMMMLLLLASVSQFNHCNRVPSVQLLNFFFADASVHWLVFQEQWPR